MGLSIKGYVLEPPRVGAANSAYTPTPNNIIADQTAWNAAYPSGSEPNPRADYLVFVLTDGLLVNAEFAWTKNEVVQRFDYFSQDQRFKTWGGGLPDVVGTLQSDANTNRLKVYAPLGIVSAAPFRVSVGPFPGQTFLATVVTSFGSPSPGEVEIYLNPSSPDDNGKLNWNATDIAMGSTYLGQTVRFQRQQFFQPKESTGNIGTLSIDGVTQTDLMLNPMPATGQFPLLRIGYGLYLTPIEVAVFTPGGPASGEVEWMQGTGELRFSAADISVSQGKPVYYDGVVFSFGQMLPRQDLGAMPAGFTSLTVADLPAAGGDVIFRLPNDDVQFPLTTRISETATFDPLGKVNEVALKPDPFPATTGQAQFSLADRTLYTGKDVQVVFGDLPIERGISLRLARCSANLSGSDLTIKDVSAFYTVTDAILADPIIGAPVVFLPAVPVDGTSTVKVEQGTGTFTSANFPRLDVEPLPTAPLTYGYTIDFDNRQIGYAQRRVAPGDGSQDLAILTMAGAMALPDTLLNAAGLDLKLNEGSGWYDLTIGQDALVDLQAGVVSFTRTYGQELVSGSTGALDTNSTFTDAGADFSNVVAGDVMVVLGGTLQGIYTITEVSGSDLTLDTTVTSTVSNIGYEIHCGRTRSISGDTVYAEEVLADRYWVETPPVDPDTKVERVVSIGTAQNATPLTIPTPFRKDKNLVFGSSVTVVTVPDDTKFTTPVTDLPVNTVEYSLATGNMNLLQADVASPRFRFDTSTFSTAVTVVDDGHFGTPGVGEVQIGLQSGSLKFNPADFGKEVFWVRQLWRKVDYKLTPELGFFDFTERFLEWEEALITYRPLTDSGPGDLVTERGTFIVRKEVCEDGRTGPTNQVAFNPDSHQVASNPAPAVFRGGRPQDSTQVYVDPTKSTVKFLPDRKYMTDALPHGSVLNTNERVYIDYYIYDAKGGEKTITVLQPPMATARILIQEESSSFTVAGDQRTTYPAGYLLRVEQDEVYILGTPTYDSATNLTTVNLAYGQVFANAQVDPKVYLPSGTTPISSFLFRLGYFVLESTPFEVVPRGMNKVRLAGDLTASYKTGIVLLMTDGSTSFVDTYLISGATYDSKTGKTEITLTQNARRQYTAGTHVMKRSVRPILEPDATVVQTSQTPILTQPYSIYRRIEGQPGRVLTTPQDYAIDDSGRITMTSSLLPTEEVAMFYTGHRMVPARSSLRPSYTSGIVPTQQNGIADQILKMSYTLFSPDTFYFRVETLSNFQGEVTQQFQKDAQGSTPSGGPVTSNASQPKLWEQGRESNYYAEGHLANTDIVVRALLKYYNDAINHLEDVLQNIDGRVVGDADGRFKFDGLLNTTPRASWADVTNQIDDIVQVSPFPIGLTPPIPFTITWIGTYQKVYLPSRWSRFFPMYRASLFGYTSPGSETGDEVADLKWTNITGSDPVLFRRWPRAMVTKAAKALATTLYVDNAIGSAEPILRPPFQVGMTVVVASPTQEYVGDGEPGHAAGPLLVTGVFGDPNPERLDVSPLPVDIPAGATVYLCTTGASHDTTYDPPNYRIGMDVGFNYDGGKIAYIKAYFPFDGSLGALIPAELCVREIGADEFVQVNNVRCNNVRTEPFRFPALDGKAMMDCGDQMIPMVGPSPNQELLKLPDSTDAVNAIVADTTATTLLTGSLDAPQTKVTATALPAPLPRIYDLIRFVTGPNSGASVGYRRVLSVVGMDITVDSAFPNAQATQEQFVVTATNDVAVGIFTLFNASTMQLPGAIPAAIHIGHTVIFTNGSAGRIGTRRQIVSLDTVNNRIGLDHAVVFPTDSTTFRVSNHLSTYSNLGALTGLSPDLTDIIRDNDHNTDPTVIDSEVHAIERLFDGDLTAGTLGVFTDILPGGTSTGTCTSGTELEDLTVDFTATTPAVSAVHFVFVRNQPNQGIYPVASVSDAHHLTINGTFTTTPTAIDYRVVSLFGLSKPAVQNIMCVLSKAETFLDDLSAFDTLLGTTYPVTIGGSVDPNVYATGVLSSDLTNWQAQITTRSTFLSSSAVNLISGVLTSTDKLYDQRFTWIDGRINTKSGVTAKQIQSIAERSIKVVEQENSLTKLVTMQKLQAPSAPSPAEAEYDPSC